MKYVVTGIFKKMVNFECGIATPLYRRHLKTLAIATCALAAAASSFRPVAKYSKQKLLLRKKSSRRQKKISEPASKLRPREEKKPRRTA
jgi:hypothetical protein